MTARDDTQETFTQTETRAGMSYHLDADRLRRLVDDVSRDLSGVPDSFTFEP